MKYAVVRINMAGVFVGYVAKMTNRKIVLVNGSRLWSWCGALCVETIARCGVSSGSRRSSFTEQTIFLENGSQIIDASNKCRESIERLPNE